MAGQMSGKKPFGGKPMGKGKSHPAKNKEAHKHPDKAEEAKEGAPKGAPEKAAPEHKPHKTPRSVHLRQAENGYILSKHGGDGDMGFPSDHIAPDFNSAMLMAREHMGSGPMTTAQDAGGGAGPVAEPPPKERKTSGES